MKILILTLSAFLSLSLFAESCDSLNMEHEREKIESLAHIPSVMKKSVLVIKRKVKHAQIFGCVDKILSGNKISMDEQEKEIALFYLKMLKETAKGNPPHLLEIENAKEEIENL